MSFVEATDGSSCSTTGAVLRACVAVENAPYALMGAEMGSVVEAASCSPGIDLEGPVAAVASCGAKIDWDDTPVAAFASCSRKIGRDGPIAAVAS